MKEASVSLRVPKPGKILLSLLVNQKLFGRSKDKPRAEMTVRKSRPLLFSC